MMRIRLWSSDPVHEQAICLRRIYTTRAYLVVASTRPIKGCMYFSLHRIKFIQDFLCRIEISTSTIEILESKPHFSASDQCIDVSILRSRFVDLASQVGEEVEAILILYISLERFCAARWGHASPWHCVAAARPRATNLSWLIFSEKLRTKFWKSGNLCGELMGLLKSVISRLVSWCQSLRSQ